MTGIRCWWSGQRFLWICLDFMDCQMVKSIKMSNEQNETWTAQRHSFSSAGWTSPRLCDSFNYYLLPTNHVSQQPSPSVSTCWNCISPGHKSISCFYLRTRERSHFTIFFVVGKRNQVDVGLFWCDSLSRPWQRCSMFCFLTSAWSWNRLGLLPWLQSGGGGVNRG